MSSYSPVEDFNALLTKEGYKVTAVNSGEEAIEESIINPPDLIVADADMPVISGFDILKSMRESGKLKKMPVIIYSVSGSQLHREKAMDMEAKDFIAGHMDTPQNVVLKIKSHLGEQKEYLIDISKDIQTVKRMAHDLGYEGDIVCPKCKEVMSLRLLRNLSLGRDIFKASLVCSICSPPSNKSSFKNNN